MFTGLIEEVGRVRRVERVSDDLQRLEIEAAVVTEDLRLGDSINCNGACQTAIAAGADHFAVESVAETLRRTTLGRLRPGDPVNLERSLRPADRMGGHIVLGHVDGVGTVRRLDRAEGDTVLEIQPPEELGRYIAGKGSVTVDGISLTVATAADDGSFTIAIIPHTLTHTNLQQVRAGDPVNLEVDVVARYVERLLAAGGSPSGGSPGLSLDGLRDLGY
jgi:riboflavin synthase